MPDDKSKKLKPAYSDGETTIHLGDCIETMRAMPESSVDAVVCDPPYGLEFMGKEWDGADGFRRSLNPEDAGRDSAFGRMSKKAPEYRAGVLFQEWSTAWAVEALRVLKPGGHMLAFGGTRTWHRLAVAIEDAGFEIRDSIAWMYGSGFPKSMDVSKAIDKAAGATREVTGVSLNARETRSTIYGAGGGFGVGGVTAPATDAARQWQGWGTALKPAFEPVVVARKPLSVSGRDATVAANVLAHGTGALNIDGARIGRAEGDRTEYGRGRTLDHANTTVSLGKFAEVTPYAAHDAGRFPANVILDESQAAALDEQSGVSKGRPSSATMRGERSGSGLPSQSGVPFVGGLATTGYEDQGGASRFFYCAKAPKSERPYYWRKSCNCETMKPCEDTSQQAGTEGSSSMDDKSWSTSTSGKKRKGDKSRRGTTSTTETTTSSTTTGATSSSSHDSSTSASTLDASFAEANGGSRAESAGSSSPSLSTTGTSAPKAGPSTDVADPATFHGWSETSVCGNCGAPSRREAHSTVKPLALMRYLVRLVTPAGGVVLDPFLGSGTTMEAAILEGFRVTGIEREEDYWPLIRARLIRAHS